MDSEKYSLRQRQKRKHSSNNNSLDSQGYASDNSLESLNNSRDAVTYCRTNKRPQTSSNDAGSGKSKAKAAPLSKYRRKTANARERTRMREINTAFETLRTCVPPCITNEDSNCTNDKLTKITTLRLAMKYIGILNEALINPNEADYDFLYDCTKPRPILHTKLEENFEPLVEIVKDKKSKSTKNNKNTKSTKSSNNTRKSSTPAAKRSAKKQKSNNTENACQTSTIPTAYQESPASNASSAYASLSSASESSASPISNSSYLFEQNAPNHSFTYTHPLHHNSMSDLSNLMLESDGESLNLSERCFSPLQTTTKSRHEPFECSPTIMQTLENPLELSLRLMEPAADSLSLSVDPIIPPPSCISPLMNLESFNAFDLFHTEFSDQSALDLFLT